MADQKSEPSIEHCIRVAEGAKWVSGGSDQKLFEAKGSALDVSVKVFAEHETLNAAPAVHEEEVATVLEGSFRIDADDESYELVVGEGIMIPPNTARTWRCTSPRGVLYRVLTLSQPEAGV